MAAEISHVQPKAFDWPSLEKVQPKPSDPTWLKIVKSVFLPFTALFAMYYDLMGKLVNYFKSTKKAIDLVLAPTESVEVQTTQDDLAKENKVRKKKDSHEIQRTQVVNSLHGFVMGIGFPYVNGVVIKQTSDHVYKSQAFKSCAVLGSAVLGAIAGYGGPVIGCLFFGGLTTIGTIFAPQTKMIKA